ncbi:MAG: hypothetical protein KGQ93_11410 [Cyanobacteria bacterium REEB459]|nr:hypothetical protein [Cyanobacteria bacterium REEB459]
MIPSYSSEPAVDPAASVSTGRQTPSVPISVYRELASELKANQALVDSLTQQNQQLEHQNQVLRQEILKFTESAFQLQQAIAPALATAIDPGQISSPSPASRAPAALEQAPYSRPLVKLDEPHSPHRNGQLHQESSPVAQFTHQLSRMLSTKPKSKPPLKPVAKARGRQAIGLSAPTPAMVTTLYREEPANLPRVGQRSEKAADLSGLWLTTTILLVVVSAFGAGFLVMKPLLHR